jgi:hypothetical protein
MKSVIVYQLPIPPELIDHVCSFLYYRIEETIARNKIKYNKVNCDLFYTVRIERLFPYYDWNYSYNHFYATLFIYNVQCNFDIQIYICCKCGNYTHPTRKCYCNNLKYV